MTDINTWQNEWNKVSDVTSLFKGKSRNVELDDNFGDANNSQSFSRIKIPPIIGGVRIVFGNTKSDGRNSNNPVDPCLVKALQYAITEALKMVSFDELYVTATTNGKHSSTSNHYRGKAIDISLSLIHISEPTRPY